MSELYQIREEIEALSHTIVKLLNERTVLVHAAAIEKRRLRLPLRDLKRESELVDRLLRASAGPLTDEQLAAVLREIFRVSLATMEHQETEDLLVSAGRGPCRIPEIKGHRLQGYIAGPCTIESEQQLETVAMALVALGVRWLRGGLWKPRTSPYSFKGLGKEGLQLLRDIGCRYNLVTVSEVTDPRNVEAAAEHVDVLQIGARNMQNFDLLREVGQQPKPVLLKRGFGATIEEFIFAAEHVADAGNDNIILCERGIRTFERETRNTLDISSIPLCRRKTRLPVIVDVSHAAGRRDILASLSQAAFAAGAQAVMVEVHPSPSDARSDRDQQLSIADFTLFVKEVEAGLAAATSAARFDLTTHIPAPTTNRSSSMAEEGG